MQAKTMVTLPFHVYLELCGGHHDRNNSFADEVDDEFLMYTYKVRRCPRSRTHDWTECPFAHRGEKARRRDPRKFPYQGIVCPEFKNGECKRGQNCEFAHGVFEFWLHPSRFRTRVCESGAFCPRKVCFFAHTPEQLRPESFPQCFHCKQQKKSMNTEVDGSPRKVTTVLTPVAETSSMASPCSGSPVSRGGEEGLVERSRGVVDEEYCDFPHLEWVVDLVN